MSPGQLHNDKWSNLRTVTRESDPEMFWKLASLELEMWLWVLVLQAGVLLALFLD